MQIQRNAVPLAQAYMARQAELGLEQVLTEERLSSSGGIDASLATIESLEQLVREHKAAWQYWLVEATRQLAAVLEELPEDERTATSDGLMASLQRNMEEQHRSLAARAAWIDATRTICRLVQRGRQIEPDATVPVFASDEDAAEFHRQLALIDAAAAAEQQLLNERAARVRDNMDKLHPQ